MWRVKILISVLIVALPMLAFVLQSTPVAAHDDRPGAGADQFPLTPDPADCQVEPRLTEELRALWFGFEGSPVATQAAADSVTIPIGARAAEETVAAVVETVVEVFSCLAAEDLARATALFTDDLTRSLGPEPGATEEEVCSCFEETPEARDEGQLGIIVAIGDVMVLADGRVGAFVVHGSEERISTSYVIFEQQGDQWLFDEIIEFGSGEKTEDTRTSSRAIFAGGVGEGARRFPHRGFP